MLNHESVKVVSTKFGQLAPLSRKQAVLRVWVRCGVMGDAGKIDRWFWHLRCPRAGRAGMIAPGWQVAVDGPAANGAGAAVGSRD